MGREVEGGEVVHKGEAWVDQEGVWAGEDLGEEAEVVTWDHIGVVCHNTDDNTLFYVILENDLKA